MKRAAKKLIACLLAAGLIVAAAAVSGCASAPVLSALNYGESAVYVANPDNGLYTEAVVRLTDAGAEGAEALVTTGGPVRLKVGLGRFCAYRGAVRPLSAGALNGLAETLEKLREANSAAILCFSYDDFENAASKEPPITAVEDHIRQLRPVFYDYEDVIAAMEVGFLGVDGSFLVSATVNDDNMYRVAAQLLAASPPSVRVLLRAPRYVYGFLGLTLQSAAGKDLVYGSAGYRLGVSDFGYCGDETDDGFYLDRSAETAWLYRQCDRSFFSARLSEQRQESVGARAVEEMFVTHTALTAADEKSFEEWKALPYNGSDELFSGLSRYDYFTCRLGYRLVLKEAYLPKKATPGDKLELSLKISNVGSAAVLRERKAEILLSGAGGVYAYPAAVDTSVLGSLTAKKFTFKIKTQKSLPEGEYKVYLRLGSRAYEGKRGGGCIGFANPSEQYEPDLGGNLIGGLLIK